jgi:hypothetical protein
MIRWAVAMFALGCTGEEADKDDEEALDPATDTDEGEPEPQDTPETGDTGQTTAGPCAADPALAITSLAAVPGQFSTLLEVQVELSSAAQAAVQCTLDSDPQEIFFAESTEAGTSHTLRLSGLIPREAYSCSAAPVCPEGTAQDFVYQTDPAPADMRQLTVEIDPVLGMEGAWTVAPFSGGAFFAQTWIVAWGPDGRPRWWWPLPAGVGVWIEARYHVGSGEFVWGGGFDEEGRIRTIDLWEGETYAWAPPGWETTEFHHDGKQIADGRLMTLEIRENSEGGDEWDGFGLRIHDPATGEVDFDYDSQRGVDEGYLRTAGGFGDSDPYHANWMDWQETDAGPVVYVSLCFEQQILALDGATGEMLWLLGADLGWTVQDGLGNTLSDEDLPQCQHGLEVDGDTLLVYDNGWQRQESSVAEWQIDAEQRIATRLWTWTDGWYEFALGDADWLPGDRVLVTKAASFGEAEITEVDQATGQVASRMRFDQGGYTYRAERYDGCDLFTSVRACEALATRYAELERLLKP